jgi:hypothetical protein
MRRERIARAALRAMPATVRAERGDELVATLLDVSGTSRSRFVTELVSLVRAGVHERAARNARAGAPRLVADGICLAGVWILTLVLAGEIGNRIRVFDPYGPWHPIAPWTLTLLVAALVLALIGYDRLAGAAALLFLAGITIDSTWSELADGKRDLLLAPLICFATMVIAPRRRSVDPRRLAWLALAAGLALAASRFGDPTGAILIFGLLFLVPFALAMLPADPRPAIALAVPTTLAGLHMARGANGPGSLGVLFLCAAPVILTLAVARIRRLQTDTAI